VFGDRHPDLVISYSQLSDLNRQIEIERKKNIETAKSEYESQREQQKSLEDQLKAVESQILVDGQALVRLQELQRDAEANRNIYEQFLSRFKTTNVQRLLQSSQTKIASLAIPPLRPTRPPLPLLFAALAIASVLISTAVVAVPGIKSVLDRPDPKIRRTNSPSLQPELPQKLPVWARIPDLPVREFARSVWQKPITATAELDLSPHLRSLIEKIDELPGSRGKVALVMSIENGAGGSTVARSLNRSAVNKGMLSVLIELQSDLPIAKPAAADRQEQGITRTDLRAVNVLLSSNTQTGAAPADDIRKEFDLIVVDASSLAAQSDVRMLAAHADLIILVTRDGAAAPTAIQQAEAGLSKFGAVPKGHVVNRVPASSVIPQGRREAVGLAS
jgi:hypothetical protein